MAAKRRSIGSSLRRGGGALLVAAGWLGYSRFLVPHQVPLPPAIDAEWREISGRAGRIGYYVAGQGIPLLLVHSVNAAASAYEMRPIFERMRATRRVYAMDLPGFGRSARDARRYDVRLFVNAIFDLLDAIAAEEGRQRVDVAALSLSAEFLAHAASEMRERIRTLTFITPTGLDRRTQDGRAGDTREVPGLGAMLEFPLWSQALYDLLVSRPSIRYFLERTWGTKAIDPAFAEYAYLTAHQPGARHAPYAFVSGRLFSADIRAVYERLVQPVWVPHGTRGDFADLGGAIAFRHRANWTIEPFDTGALPHVERPDEFVRRYARFLEHPG
jgi:pimeloyl-ACP methyl ester carboxylesterase